MDGKQRCNGDNNNSSQLYAGIQLSYDGFDSTACLSALLIVSLVY